MHLFPLSSVLGRGSHELLSSLSDGSSIPHQVSSKKSHLCSFLRSWSAPPPFGHICGMWKFWGQGSNQYHSSDNPGSPTKVLFVHLFLFNSHTNWWGRFCYYQHFTIEKKNLTKAKNFPKVVQSVTGRRVHISESRSLKNSCAPE